MDSGVSGMDVRIHNMAFSKNAPLFTLTQMFELSADRRVLREVATKERLEPYVKAAVAFYAEQIRWASGRILGGLKTGKSSGGLVWSLAFQFNSYDFGALDGRGYLPLPSTTFKWWSKDMRGLNAHQAVYQLDHCGAMFAALRADGEVCTANEDLVSMWVLFRHTDFCQRLLAELSLDPKQFEFKNLSEFAPVEDRLFKDDKIIEYRNKVHLVYSERPTKKRLNPLAEAWTQHVKPLEEMTY